MKLVFPIYVDTSTISDRVKQVVEYLNKGMREFGLYEELGLQTTIAEVEFDVDSILADRTTQDLRKAVDQSIRHVREKFPNMLLTVGQGEYK